MSRHRHRIAIVVGLATIGVTMVTVDTPAHALGSPAFAVALAGVAAAVTLERSPRRS